MNYVVNSVLNTNKVWNHAVYNVYIYFNGHVYRDILDLTSAQAYEFIYKASQFWKSSSASPEEYAAAYKELAKNANNILVITISAKLSMFYNSAMVARDMVRTEIPTIEIEILDSETAAAAEGLIALAATQAVN